MPVATKEDARCGSQLRLSLTTGQKRGETPSLASPPSSWAGAGGLGSGSACGPAGVRHRRRRRHLDRRLTTQGDSQSNRFGPSAKTSPSASRISSPSSTSPGGDWHRGRSRCPNSTQSDPSADKVGVLGAGRYLGSKCPSRCAPVGGAERERVRRLAVVEDADERPHRPCEALVRLVGRRHGCRVASEADPRGCAPAGARQPSRGGCPRRSSRGPRRHPVARCRRRAGRSSGRSRALRSPTP